MTLMAEQHDPASDPLSGQLLPGRLELSVSQSAVEREDPEGQ